MKWHFGYRFKQKGNIKDNIYDFINVYIVATKQLGAYTNCLKPIVSLMVAR